MSFSGLKTAVVNLAHNAAQTGRELDKASLALDFTNAVSDMLVPRAMAAAQQCGRTTVVAAGRCSSQFHHPCGYAACLPGAWISVVCAALVAVRGQRAMIGAQGYYEFRAGRRAETDLNAFATLDIAAG